jgi:Tol biopolymer transport system component
VNSPEYEYGPWVTPDGRRLLFTSHRAGDADIYQIEIRSLNLEIPRP